MTTILGRAVIWELNQAALSLIAVGRALTLTVKPVPLPVIRGFSLNLLFQIQERHFSGAF
jgi:hypothetical protein